MLPKVGPRHRVSKLVNLGIEVSRNIPRVVLRVFAELILALYTRHFSDAGSQSLPFGKFAAFE